MPPPGGIAGMGVSFFGFSATIASVVMKQSGNRGCILQGGADDLGRVNDALGHQVTVLAFAFTSMGISLPASSRATGADGNHLAPRRLFFGGVRNDDAAGRLLIGLDALDDDPVMKRPKLHRILLDHCNLVRFR